MDKKTIKPRELSEAEVVRAVVNALDTWSHSYMDRHNHAIDIKEAIAKEMTHQRTLPRDSGIPGVS